MTKKIAYRRNAFTLIEMMVVIAIILALAALAAAFAPRVNDNQKMTRAVDNLEQWLLTAKMRAKRDGLSTGLRFIQAPGDANLVPGPAYSQFQYIQQPEPLSGGACAIGGPGAYLYTNPITLVTNSYSGGLLTSAGSGTVTFAGVDFWLGNLTPPPNPLVQPGDYLEINGGGVYSIAVVKDRTTLLLGPPLLPLSRSLTDSALSILPSNPTTNYRIIRQPRILIGEEPLALPNNYAANYGFIPGYTPTGRYPPNDVLFGVYPPIVLPPSPGTNVRAGTSGYPEILFSPSGAVIGTNAATPILWISVWDVPQQLDLASKLLADPNLVGIVGIQGRSGFIGAYSVSLSGNPFLFVQSARESGL